MMGSSQAETEIPLDLSEQVLQAPDSLEVLACPRPLLNAHFVCIIENMPYPENPAVIDDNKVDDVLIKCQVDNQEGSKAPD